MSDRTAWVERFGRFAREEPIDLWKGSLLVSGLVDPKEDLDNAGVEIERLTRRIREVGGASPGHTALIHVLFSEERLRGDTDSYDDPANSSVVRVLEKKTGMPITLSIVTLEVGRRVGLRLSGVGLPGHFVVGGEDLPQGEFLDPFDGGKLRDARALTLRVSAIFGAPIALPQEAFAPDSPRAILMRLLFNLRRSWERRERFDEALSALACAEALAPQDASFLRERGLLLLRAGRSQEALDSLAAYVQVADAEDAEPVGKLISIVRQGLESSEGELAPAQPAAKKIFTLDEAREALPQVAEITSRAVFEYARLAEQSAEEERQEVVRQWVREISALGAEIKGLWLVDFDSGSGYYCWKYPEPALEYFHGYEEGFAGRLPLQ